MSALLEGLMLITHSHGFPDDQARERVLALTEYWATRYAMKGAWRGDAYHIAGKTKGVRFDATFTLHSGRVEVEVKVPFFARQYGRAYVERKLVMYLDDGCTLDSLLALNQP